jgi:hypothetical protein
VAAVAVVFAAGPVEPYLRKTQAALLAGAAVVALAGPADFRMHDLAVLMPKEEEGEEASVFLAATAQVRQVLPADKVVVVVELAVRDQAS